LSDCIAYKIVRNGIMHNSFIFLSKQESYWYVQEFSRCLNCRTGYWGFLQYDPLLYCHFISQALIKPNMLDTDVLKEFDNCEKILGNDIENHPTTVTGIWRFHFFFPVFEELITCVYALNFCCNTTEFRLIALVYQPTVSHLVLQIDNSILK
jgi:hypothetical protein